MPEEQNDKQKFAITDPKPFKKSLLINEGTTFCKIDFSVAQNKVLAHIAPDCNAIEIIEPKGLAELKQLLYKAGLTECLETMLLENYDKGFDEGFSQGENSQLYN